MNCLVDAFIMKVTFELLLVCHKIYCMVDAIILKVFYEPWLVFHNYVLSGRWLYFESVF